MWGSVHSVPGASARQQRLEQRLDQLTDHHVRSPRQPVRSRPGRARAVGRPGLTAPLRDASGAVELGRAWTDFADRQERSPSLA
jgi:hypothetical protein